MGGNACEYCAYYAYDELTDTYMCEIDLDEDEVAGFLSGSADSCHYFRLEDEYGIVRKQN